MSAILAHLSRPSILAPLVITAVYLVHHYLTKERVVLPKSFPVINSRPTDRFFPYLRAKFRNTVNFKSTMMLANTKPYNTKPAILPLLGIPNLILLPTSDIQFIQEQPRSILDPAKQTDQRLQLQFTSPNPDLMDLHQHVAQNRTVMDYMTTQIGNLVPDLVDELEFAGSKYWGDETSTSEWKEVGVYKTMTGILALVSNRIFIGSPLNRTQEIIKVGMQYSVDVPVVSAVIRCLWDPVVPLVGWLLTIPVRRRARQFEKLLEPEITKRVKAWDGMGADGDGDTGKKVSSLEPEPNDAIQWCLKSAKASDDPLMWKSTTIADRILIMNFASIHTSDYVLTQVLLDLAHSKQDYLDQLREEVETALRENGGWNKRTIGRLVKLDSTLRESARLNSFQPAALPRVVVAEEGIKTPSSGDVVIPKGAVVVVPAYNVMHDERVYKGAELFKPFRFVGSGQGFVQTSSEYLAFGHGKYACQGRFFASVELKTMLAWLLLHYDIKIKKREERPPSSWLVWNVIQPLKAAIEVKRREVLVDF
ncbi:Cytochrome P450 [Rhypophila decipiens]